MTPMNSAVLIQRLWPLTPENQRENLLRGFKFEHPVQEISYKKERMDGFSLRFHEGKTPGTNPKIYLLHSGQIEITLQDITLDEILPEETLLVDHKEGPVLIKIEKKVLYSIKFSVGGIITEYLSKNSDSEDVFFRESFLEAEMSSYHGRNAKRLAAYYRKKERKLAASA